MSDRFVCPPTHKHAASSTCYGVHRCRCDECRAGRAWEYREGERRKRTGQVQEFVSAEPVREHLYRLADAGWRTAHISQVSGVSIPTIGRLRTGRTNRVTVESAEAILGTTVSMRDRASAPFKVPSTGTRRRLQALATLGWSRPALGRMLNIDAGQISVLAQKDGLILRTTHDRVATLYRELLDRPPVPRNTGERVSVTRTKRHAAAQGYIGPMQWNNIDDPNETPEPEPVRTAETIESFDETITVLHSDGWFDDRIAAHIGLHTRQVGRIRERLGLPSNRHRNAA